jgi:hypothetical protein
MTTTAGHSFYIGPIGSFYNQVNDAGSWEPLDSIRFQEFPGCVIQIWPGDKSVQRATIQNDNCLVVQCLLKKSSFFADFW